MLRPRCARPSPPRAQAQGRCEADRRRLYHAGGELAPCRRIGRSPPRVCGLAARAPESCGDLVPHGPRLPQWGARMPPVTPQGRACCGRRFDLLSRAAARRTPQPPPVPSSRSTNSGERDGAHARRHGEGTRGSQHQRRWSRRPPDAWRLAAVPGGGARSLQRCQAAIFSLSARRTSLTVTPCRRKVRQAAMRSSRDRSASRRTRRGQRGGVTEGSRGPLERANEGTL
jgi:hypothetical protein